MIDLSASLASLISLPDLNCALALQARRRAWDELDRMSPLSFGERGQIALQFERRSLWRLLENPFHSFDAWLSSGSEAGRSTMYAAWRAAKQLEDDVPDLAGIPRQTVETLTQLSSELRRQPEVIEAAKAMQPCEFEAHISEVHPEQHIEKRRRRMIFDPMESDAQTIDKAISQAIEDGAVNRNEALTRLAITYLGSALAEKYLEEAKR